MSALHPKPLRRRIISMLLWTAALLLLTNVCWSVWSAMISDYSRGLGGSHRGAIVELGSDRMLDLSATTSPKTWTRYVLLVVNAPTDDSEPPELEAFTEVAPRWLQQRYPAERVRSRPGGTEFVEQSVGWPVRLLAVGCEFDPTTDHMNKGGIRIFGPSDSTDDWFQGILPVRPILVGQSFYAAFWLAVVWGVPFARRRLRMRRGHCPICNYNLRGNTTGVCPECGAKRQPPTAS